MQRRLRMLQVPRRGPYGRVGPGVLLPEISQFARPLVPYVEAIEAGFAGAGAFINAVIAGASGALGAEDRERLQTRLLQSTVLNAVFPPVFLAGGRRHRRGRGRRGEGI